MKNNLLEIIIVANMKHNLNLCIDLIYYKNIIY